MMRFGKLLAGITFGFIFGVSAAQAASSSFADVKDKHDPLYLPYIETLFENNLITGETYSDGTLSYMYYPDKEINRAEYTKVAVSVKLAEEYGVGEGWADHSDIGMVFRMIDEKLGYFHRCENDFSGCESTYSAGVQNVCNVCRMIGSLPYEDVPENSWGCEKSNTCNWFTPYVYYATAKGMVKGYQETYVTKTFVETNVESQVENTKEQMNNSAFEFVLDSAVDVATENTGQFIEDITTKTLFKPEENILRLHALKLIMADNGNIPPESDARYSRLLAKANARGGISGCVDPGIDRLYNLAGGYDNEDVQKLVKYVILADRLNFFGYNCEVLREYGAHGSGVADFFMKPISRKEVARYFVLSSNYPNFSSFDPVTEISISPVAEQFEGESLDPDAQEFTNQTNVEEGVQDYEDIYQYSEREEAVLNDMACVELGDRTRCFQESGICICDQPDLFSCKEVPPGTKVITIGDPFYEMQVGMSSGIIDPIAWQKVRLPNQIEEKFVESEALNHSCELEYDLLHDDDGYMRPFQSMPSREDQMQYDNMWNEVEESRIEKLSEEKGFFGNLGNWIDDTLGGIVGAAKDALGPAIQEIDRAISKADQFISDNVCSPLIPNCWSYYHAKGAMRAVKGAALDMIDFIGAPVQATIDLVAALWNIQETAKAAWDMGSEYFSEFYNDCVSLDEECLIKQGEIGAEIGLMFIGVGEVKAFLKFKRIASIAKKLDKIADVAAYFEKFKVGKLGKVEDLVKGLSHAIEDVGQHGKIIGGLKKLEVSFRKDVVSRLHPKKFATLVQDAPIDDIRKLLDGLDPRDVSRLLSEFDDMAKVAEYVGKFNKATRVKMLKQLNTKQVKEVLDHLPEKKITETINGMAKAGDYRRIKALMDEGVDPKRVLKPYTESNYLENFRRYTGRNPDSSLFQAHHMFPQKFADRFLAKGINVHDPQYLSWWDNAGHQSVKFDYNDLTDVNLNIDDIGAGTRKMIDTTYDEAKAAFETEMGKFLDAGYSKEQLLERGRELADQYNLEIYF